MMQCVEIRFDVDGMPVTLQCCPPASRPADPGNVGGVGAFDWQKFLAIAACVASCIAAEGGRQTSPTPKAPQPGK